MTRQSKLFTYALTALFIGLIAITTIMTGGGAQFASAAASAYSDVLEDLRTDANFTVDGFPVIERDYSLQVIQIAESEQDELLIYVYQPSGQKADLRASSINIAKSENATAEFKNYKLTFQTSNGVFYKYSVDGFELSTASVRYYNISNILRPYDKVIDEPPAAEQTITEVPNAVGQLWTVYPNSDSVTYEPSTIITVTEKHVGYVNYAEGFNFGWTMTNGATSAHFVAFSTDKPIDQLISADVSFNEREVTYQQCFNSMHIDHRLNETFNYQYGDKVKHEPDPVTLTYKDKIENVGKNKYTWDRIRTTSEFLADENNSDYNLTSESSTGIEGTQWVLNFYETPIEIGVDILDSPGLAGDANCRRTEVSDVMILRLKYEYDGEPYNVGVVDNKQTGSNRPGNVPTGSGCAATWEKLGALPWWSWFLIIPGAIIVSILFACLIVLLVKLPFKLLTARRTQTAATSVKRAKTKHSKGATSKRKPKTPKKRGGKK